MFIGPVFTRELVTSPRRWRMFLYRTIYAGGLLLLMCTAWLLLAGTQVIRNVSDMARFGGILFQILAPLQLALGIFFAAMMSASAVAQEKDRETLILLLMTRLNNSELVLGKLMSSLVNILVMLLAGLPVFMFCMLFGGISTAQVGSVFVVTVASVLVAGSLGSLIALYREKTFQTLALTCLALVFWIGCWEGIERGLLGTAPLGLPAATWGAWFSPLSAVRVAARPNYDLANWIISPGIYGFLVFAACAACLLNIVAIAMVRVWNPSREVRGFARAPATSPEPAVDEGAPVAMPLAAADRTGELRDRDEQARSGHVDSQLRRRGKLASRHVWDFPILWREVCTWAYGRKILAIRGSYWVLFVMTAAALWWVMHAPEGRDSSDLTGLQGIALPLVPFFLLSLVTINALAVTSITNERDGRSLDLLLVTDLSPTEFLFGKLGGIWWNTRDMILLPIVLCGFLWWHERLTAENFWYVTGGLLVMVSFVSMLGVHCGTHYANSRTAIGASLGTVFFLFLGVLTCIVLMVSFSGQFQSQLAPFLAFILGGGVGLYVALGARIPSPAIGMASISLPFATFYAIVSFLMGWNLPVFLVSALAYGFATAAMMIPALSEFDFATVREAIAEE